MLIALKSQSFRPLEYSGSVQACNRIILTFISLWNTALSFCWADWLKTIWYTSDRMDRYRPNTLPFICGVDVRIVSYFKMALYINVAVFSQRCVWCFLPFEVSRYIAVYSVSKCRDRFIVWKCREKITLYRDVKWQKCKIFMHLFTKREFLCYVLEHLILTLQIFYNNEISTNMLRNGINHCEIS
jgi:hypothetical protein